MSPQAPKSNNLLYALLAPFLLCDILFLVFGEAGFLAQIIIILLLATFLPVICIYATSCSDEEKQK